MELEINGQTYRMERKLNGFEQLYVSRKLAPLFTQLAALAPGGGGTAQVLAQSLTNFTPIAQALAGLPEEDVRGVIGQCLMTISRREPGGIAWMPIWNREIADLQYNDIDMGAMLRLTWMIVMENLRGFIPAAVLSGLPTAATPSPQP